MSALRFVRFGTEHVDRVVNIAQASYPERWSKNVFLSEIQNPASHFYVLFVDDTLAGYGGFWLVVDEAHITSVTVSPEFRQRGLGRRLLRFLLHLAVGLGATLATLEVRASNERARRLYLSEGFREVGLRKGYYSGGTEDAVLMQRDLRPEDFASGNPSTEAATTERRQWDA